MILEMLLKRAERNRKEEYDKAYEFFPEPKAREYFETVRCKLTPPYYYRELGKIDNSFMSFGMALIHRYNGKCRLNGDKCGYIDIYHYRSCEKPTVDIDGLDCRKCNVPLLFAMKTQERDQ